MISRALTLSLIAACALAACKPATPPASDATGASPAAPSTAPSAAPPAGKPSTLARIAGDLNPLPDPRDAIKASMDRFVAVRSYHATMDFEGGPGGMMGRHEIDFVAPDRFRMQTPMGTQIIIGDTMYMHVQGRTMKMPMPKGTLTQWRDPAKLAQSEAGMTVQAQGSDTIDGAPARKYLVHHEQPRPTDVTMWLNGDGLPVRIQVASLMQGKTVTSTTNYSRFNDPTIQVEPPQ
ncbi:hypothetical protein [Cognatiluteimonas profundi]|uniref:hypothetical protein n=1 Tax=Cognatiluteimonas profundi TaxID=2594501 RepID=UPI00131E2671|nr:hypothetical protein [Lysobacter profundi]